jgi:hypothetical protein
MARRRPVVAPADEPVPEFDDGDDGGHRDGFTL